MRTANDSGVFVVAGPSGVGKGTVLAQVVAAEPRVWVSISATTRAPRPGEVDGVHYHFVSDAEFDALVASDQMLEWAVVHGKHRYGTPRELVEKQAKLGRIVILEVDLAGARQVRESMPNAQQIFIAPPSFNVLEERLRGRSTETEDQIQQRLATARTELAAESEFEFVVENDSVSGATAQILHILGLSR